MSEAIQQKGVQQQGGIQKREPDPVAQIARTLDSMKLQLAAALPRHLTPERVSRVFLTTLRQSPALLKCSPASLFGAIFQASQLGLEIGNGLGHAYLVPYGREATLIIGYKGLVDLARRSGQVSTIYAVEVRKGDLFKYSLGTDPSIKHEPGQERGLEDKDISHVYAVCKLKDGSTQFEVMSIPEVDKIRKRSRASKDGPWVTDFAMMARKTVLRRLSKMLPASIELQTAIALDESADANLSQVFDVDLPAYALEAPKGDDQVAETPHDPVTGEVVTSAATVATRQPGEDDAP